MSLRPLATGAQRCFDTGGDTVNCEGSGQDGEYQSGRSLEQNRFTTENGCVTDHLTNLIWSQNANPLDFPLTWEEALAAIADLNRDGFLGFDDWRLPNRRELTSLIDYANRKPALPSDHPFSDLFLGWYWSSTTAAIAVDHAWYVHLEGGRMFYGGKDQSYMVWPVRGGGSGPDADLYQTGQQQSYGTEDDGHYRMGRTEREERFEMIADEVVADRLTGLKWHRNANLANKPLTWQESLDYLAQLRKQRDESWRLPNINELESLVDCEHHTPALPSNYPFTGIEESYWSSTSSGFEPDWAFALYLHKGAVGVGQKKDPHFYLWPVYG